MRPNIRQQFPFPWQSHGAVAVAVGVACVFGSGCASDFECSAQTYLTGSLIGDVDWTVETQENCALSDGHEDPSGILSPGADTSTDTWAIVIRNDRYMGNATYRLLVVFPSSDAPTFPGSYPVDVTFESPSDEWKGSCTATIPSFEAESWTRTSFVDLELVVGTCTLENLTAPGDIIQMESLTISGHFTDS
jgi:hypothetical protein